MSLRICFLGSGSSGNAAFVATGNVRLLIDAGFSFLEITKRLAAIGEDPQNLDGVLISHEHSDHIRGLRRLAKKLSCPIYVTGHTNNTLDWNGSTPRLEMFEAGQTIVAGDLEVDTFTIPHDAADPVGFCVRSQGLKIGLVTDLGYMPESVKHHIRGCHLLALESNHDVEMLRVSPYPFFVRQRVAGRHGHLSNQTVSNFLARDFDRQAQVLVLAHLSDINNHPEIARMVAEQALQQAGAEQTRLLIARQGEPSGVFEL